MSRIVCAECKRGEGGRPTKCHGSHCHVAACRPGRPLCRWQRAVTRGAKGTKDRSPCHCGCWHFPHRAGSCVKHGGIPAAISSSPSWKRQQAG